MSYFVSFEFAIAIVLYLCEMDRNSAVGYDDLFLINLFYLIQCTGIISNEAVYKNLKRLSENFPIALLLPVLYLFDAVCGECNVLYSV